jgi:hypothetical protein
MRNFTPQVETAEIADSDLDSISGGVGVSGGFSAGVGVDGVADLVSTATNALPLGQVTGLVSGATSTLTGLTGLTGITGLAGL